MIYWHLQIWCQSPYETLWENRSKLVWALKLNDVMWGDAEKQLEIAKRSLFRQIEMEYGRHCVRTAKAGNRLTFGDILAIKYSRLQNVTTERKEPHSCTIDGNIDSH